MPRNTIHPTRHRYGGCAGATQAAMIACMTNLLDAVRRRRARLRALNAHLSEVDAAIGSRLDTLDRRNHNANT